jgi:hypothetical protein
MPLLRKSRHISSEFLTRSASVRWNLVLLTVLCASVSSAATILDTGVVALRATDPTQLGRLDRSGGVPSDWSTPKAFPGVVNPTVSYRYETFSLANIPLPYIQITIDDVSGTAQTFASAYLNAYTPNNAFPNYGLNLNYLGDAGNSGNYFGTDPIAFQVVLPVGATLVLVVNDTSATGAGIGQPFRLLVEGFADTSFNEAPEPATFGLLLAALGVGGFIVGKRRSVSE